MEAMASEWGQTATPLKSVNITVGSNQFQNIDSHAAWESLFFVTLTRIRLPKMEFDDTSSVIWGVRKWQCYRRGVSKINNLSVALTRVNIFRYSHSHESQYFHFCNTLHVILIFFLELIRGIRGNPRKRAKIGRPDPPEHTRRGPGWREFKQTPSNYIWSPYIRWGSPCMVYRAPYII